MTLLQGLTIFVSIFFIVRNKIDFLLLFFLSLILYSWQVIYGVIWVPPYMFDASPQSQWIISIVMIILFIMTILNDLLVRNIRPLEYNSLKEGDELAFFSILTLVSYIASFYALYKGWGNLFAGKAEFLRSTGIGYYFITYFPATMAFLFYLVSGRYKYAVIAFIPLLFYLLVGYRAAIVTATIFGIFIVFFNERIFKLKILKPILLVSTLFIFFAVYKFSNNYFKAGDISGIADAIVFFNNLLENDPRFDNVFEFTIYYMFSAEFGTTSSNLSLSSSLNLSEHYSFSTTLIGAIPFLDFFSGVGEEQSRFSTVIEAYANPGFSYGLGSSFWGEIFQAGGYMGVAIAAMIVISIILSYNLSFFRSKEKFTLFTFFIAFLAFYIHSNDFVLVIAYLKNTFFLCILGFSIIWLIKNKISMNLLSRK
ncbi:MAG: hypothetical protein CMD35_01240 [Flavobacteriales bacterium]|nr:hypothetical protein [Flavobacteriales bacterium]